MKSTTPSDDATPAPVDLSIVIPALNEEQSIPELVDRIGETLTKTSYAGRFEILFVDDGSTDGTVETIRRLSTVHPYLRVAVMRANIGKAMALMIGFSKARGEIIITMDADLQDNPEDIPSLIAKLQNGGYDMVCGWRYKREDTPARRAGSWLFNKFIHRLTGLDIRDQNCGFKAYRATLTRRLNVYGHFHRLLPMQAYLLGYSVGQAPVNNSARKYGSSKYRTFRYEGFFDFLSVFFAVRFGYAPLHFFGILSMFFVIPGGALLLYLITRHFVFLLTGTSGELLVERPLLNLSLTTVLTGLIILTTGFVCDFILYHHARTNVRSMVEFALKDIHDFGARTEDAAKAERPRAG